MKLSSNQIATLQQRWVIVATLLAVLIALVIFSASCGGGGTTAAPLAANAPTVNLSPTSVVFSSQPCDKSSTARSVSLANGGNTDLTITSVAVTGPDASSFVQTNNCGTLLGAGAQCTIAITFTASASGSHAASLTVTDNAAGSPHTVSLSGTATAAAATVSLSRVSLAFGNRSVGTTSTAQAVFLTNSGNTPLSITGLGFAGANAGDFALANGCGSTVAAGANCTIGVTFTPAASGLRAATLNIVDIAGGGSQIVSLSGTGTSAAAATLNLSSSSLVFGSQPIEMTSSAQTVTLTNTGTATLNITSLGVTGTNASEYVETGSCGSSIPAGANCRITVMFTPAAAGTRTAAPSIAGNATGSAQTVSLSGTGSHDVILSWAASSTAGVIGYNVYRGTTSGGEGSTPINSAPTNGATYTDQDVTAGSTYYYLVAAIASNGTASADSNEAAATVPSP